MKSKTKQTEKDAPVDKTEAVPTDLVPVETDADDSAEDKKPTPENPIGKNPVGKNPVGKNPVGKDGDSSVKSPTSSDVRSPTSTEVTSPTRTSTEVTSPTRTSTEVRSPTRTATSTDAYTSNNITVTGGAGAGATNVTIVQAEKEPMDKADSVSGSDYFKGDAEAEPKGKENKKKVKITKEQYDRLFSKKIIGKGEVVKTMDEQNIRYMNKKEQEILAVKEKLIIENFHRVSKQLGMITENISVEEGFLGMMGGEEKSRLANLTAQFDKLAASGAIGDKKAFLEKAAQDNHSGSLTTKPGTGGKFAGKQIIIYTPKPTTMQKLATGTGDQTLGV